MLYKQFFFMNIFNDNNIQYYHVNDNNNIFHLMDVFVEQSIQISYELI